MVVMLLSRAVQRHQSLWWGEMNCWWGKQYPILSRPWQTTLQVQARAHEQLRTTTTMARDRHSFTILWEFCNRGTSHGKCRLNFKKTPRCAICHSPLLSYRNANYATRTPLMRWKPCTALKSITSHKICNPNKIEEYKLFHQYHHSIIAHHSSTFPLGEDAPPGTAVGKH